MDYFSDLMDSYAKLKKRTFKLTYISEAEENGENQEVKAEPGGPAESALLDILGKAKPGEGEAIKDAAYPGLAAFKMWIGMTGAFPEGVVSTGSNLGQTYVLDKNKAWVTTPKAVKMKEALLNAMGGGKEGELSPGQKADAAVEDNEAQEAIDQAAREQERYNSLRDPEVPFTERKDENGLDVYSLDKNEDGNIREGVAAIKQTMKSLKNFCLSITTDPKPNYCELPGTYLAGQAQAAFAYKIANGRAVGIDGVADAPLPPDLVIKASQNHRDLIKFLTGEATDEDCETIGDKVGLWGKKLLLYGDTKETGVVLNSQNALQKDAVDAAKKRCGKFKPENQKPPSSGTSIHTLRATVDEKSMIAAVNIAKCKTGKVGIDCRKKAYRDLAAYISEKAVELRAHAEKQIAEDKFEALSFGAAEEESIIMEQARMADVDGGRALVEYTLMTVNRHMQFAKLMNADSAGDMSKGGGSGGRSDTVLYYAKGDEGRSRALAAAAEMGLDESAVTPSIDEAGEWGWEIGVGQKDTEGSLGSFKLGEYNNTQRRRDAISGKLGDNAAKDPKFQEGFTERWDTQQFGDEGRKSDRFKDMMRWEGAMEAEVTAIMKTLTHGTTYVSNGKIKAVQPEVACESVSAELTSQLSYDEMRHTELGMAAGGPDVDFGNATARAKLAEVLGRQVRLRSARKAIDAVCKPADEEQCEKDKQAATDWIVRNAIMTGANYRDIVTVETSHLDNASIVTRHNDAFIAMTDPNASLSFDWSEGGSSVRIISLIKAEDEEGYSDLTPEEQKKKEDTESEISLTFEGTSKDLTAAQRSAIPPQAATRETRTTVRLSKASALKNGRRIEGPTPTTTTPEEKLNNSTMEQYMLGQIKLLESLVNQSKGNHPL